MRANNRRISAAADQFRQIRRIGLYAPVDFSLASTDFDRRLDRLEFENSYHLANADSQALWDDLRLSGSLRDVDRARSLLLALKNDRSRNPSANLFDHLFIRFNVDPLVRAALLVEKGG